MSFITMQLSLTYYSVGATTSSGDDTDQNGGQYPILGD